MNRFFPIAHVLGMVTMLFSLTMLAPLTLSWWLQDGAMAAYDEAIVTTFLAGLLTWWSTRRAKRELKIRDGFLLVVLIWSSLAAFATIPLMVYLPELSFTDAYFETISGLTTSGASVLSGLDQPAALDQLLADRTGLAGRNGPDRAGCGRAPASRYRRSSALQGGNTGADERQPVDAAHHRNGKGAVAGLCRHYRGLHAVISLGRDELVRCRHPRFFYHGPGRVFFS